MRHSNIALTMGTYTDARLLDTAEAIEALPMVRTKTEIANDPATDRHGETRETITEMAGCSDAPAVVQRGQIESIADHLANDDTDAPETKKPRDSLGIAGFLEVGDTEFESVTSTMSTWRSNQLS